MQNISAGYQQELDGKAFYVNYLCLVLLPNPWTAAKKKLI